eukprot:gene12621-14813_t
MARNNSKLEVLHLLMITPAREPHLPLPHRAKWANIWEDCGHKFIKKAVKGSNHHFTFTLFKKVLIEAYQHKTNLKSPIASKMSEYYWIHDANGKTKVSLEGCDDFDDLKKKATKIPPTSFNLFLLKEDGEENWIVDRKMREDLFLRKDNGLIIATGSHLGIINVGAIEQQGLLHRYQATIDEIGTVELAPDDTVFVDRQREVQEMALCALKILSFFKSPADQHNSVVPIPLATQMWGSGKTKLGRSFIQRIAEDKDGIKDFLRVQGSHLATKYLKHPDQLEAAIESLSQHITVEFNFKWFLPSLELEHVRGFIANDGWTPLFSASSVIAWMEDNNHRIFFHFDEIQTTVLNLDNFEAAKILYILWRDIFLPLAANGYPVYVSGRSSVLLSLSHGLYRHKGLTSPDKSRMIHIVLHLFDLYHIKELLELYYKGHKENDFLAKQILKYTSGVPRLVIALVRSTNGMDELVSLMAPLADPSLIVSFFKRQNYTMEILPLDDIPIDLNEELNSQAIWKDSTSTVLKSTLIEHYHVYISPIRPAALLAKRKQREVDQVDQVDPFIVSSALLPQRPTSSATSSPTMHSTRPTPATCETKPSAHYVMVQVPLITIILVEDILRKPSSSTDNNIPVDLIKLRLAQLSGCWAL